MGNVIGYNPPNISNEEENLEIENLSIEDQRERIERILDEVLPPRENVIPKRIIEPIPQRITTEQEVDIVNISRQKEILDERGRRILTTFNQFFANHIPIAQRYAICGDMAIGIHLDDADRYPQLNTKLFTSYVYQTSPKIKPMEYLGDLAKRFGEIIKGASYLKNKIAYFQNETGIKDYFEYQLFPDTDIIVFTIFGYEVAMLAYRKITNKNFFEYGNLNVLKLCGLMREQLTNLAYIERFEEYQEYNVPNKTLLKDVNIKYSGIGSISEFLLKKIAKEASVEVAKITDDFIPTNSKEESYFRLYLLFFHFYDPKTTGFISFIPGKSSCSSLAYSGDYMFADKQKDIEYCLSKSFFGNFDSDKSNKADDISIELMKHWNNINDIDLGLENKNSQYLLWWSEWSSKLTDKLDKYYVRKKFNISYEMSEEHKKTAKALQKVVTAKTIDRDIQVYKTGRNFIFMDGKFTAELKVGDRIFQHIFHSTTINPTIPLIGFSSYETGLAGYVINVPKGFPCIYIRAYSEFPNEYELLLPYGTIFEIRAVHKDGYIGAGHSKIFYKMVVYEVDVSAQEVKSEIDFPPIIGGEVKPSQNLFFVADDSPQLNV